MQPWYSSRESVKGALDFAETARNNAAVDRAVAAASRQVDRLCNRRGFWPLTATRRFDWPSLASPTPGRIWLDGDLLIQLTAATSGAVALDVADVLLYPDAGPPYSRVEIDRSTSTSFGLGQTSQRDVALTGVWGDTLDTDPAGALAGAVVSTTATSVTVTDSAAVGVGDLLVVDSERLLVAGKAMTTTGQTVAGGGLAAAAAANTLTLDSGTGIVGEVLLIDSERVRVDDVAGAVLTVKRGWDGTTLAAHTAGAVVRAPRQLTVVRGAAGTTAATHADAAAVARHAYPALVVQLTVAEACAALLAEGAGWARQAGAGERKQDAVAGGLEGLREDVVEQHGRRTRARAV